MRLNKASHIVVILSEGEGSYRYFQDSSRTFRMTERVYYLNASQE